MTELLSVWKDGQTYAMTPATLVDELTYCNYRFNRDRSPEITPAQWGKIFPNIDRLEQRYQAERAR
jgi:hypothetical protein